MGETWRRQCPHCKQRITIDLDARVIHRPGRRAVASADRLSRVDITNPVEASDSLWAWRDRLGMSISRAAAHVGINKSTWRNIEEAERGHITKMVHTKIKEATGICL